MSTSGAPPAAPMRCARTNNASAATASMALASVQAGQCRAGPSISASISRPRPSPASAAPGQSIDEAEGSRDSGRWRASFQAARPSGTLTRKITRQDRPNRSACTIQPPSTWPAMAASPSVMPSRPNARRRAWPP